EWRTFVFLLASGAAIALFLRALRRQRRPLRPESRVYLELRRAYARSGWDDDALVRQRATRTREAPIGAQRGDGARGERGDGARDAAPALSPLAWVAALRRAGAPAVERAERVTRRYLAARFGGVRMSAEELRALGSEVARVQTALRAAPSR